MTDARNASLHIARQGLTRDLETGDTVFTSEELTVEDGVLTRHIRDPFGLVRTAPHVSRDRVVVKWELRGQLDRANLASQYRRLPEARRRQVDREIAERQRRAASATAGQMEAD